MPVLSGREEDKEVSPPDGELPEAVGPDAAEELKMGYGAEYPRDELMPPEMLDVGKLPEGSDDNDVKPPETAELPVPVGPAVKEPLPIG